MEKGVNMKLSYTTWRIGAELDFDKSVELALATGCAGIEFRTGGLFPHGIETSLTAEQRKEKRRLFEDKYLEVSCLNSQFMMHDPDPAERTKIVEGIGQMAELAADLGCPSVRVFGNIIPDGVNAQDCVKYVGETLGKAADIAAPFSVDILIEMHGQFNFWGYTLAALKYANKPNTGILYNCDTRDLVGGSARETFLRVKDFVRHIHMHDLDRSYPYLQLFEELVRMDYDGYVSAEISGSSDPTAVLKLHNICVRTLYDLARLRVGVGLTG
jgi:sugar phosphate isomerase/epimerase